MDQVGIQHTGFPTYPTLCYKEIRVPPKIKGASLCN